MVPNFCYTTYDCRVPFFVTLLAIGGGSIFVILLAMIGYLFVIPLTLLQIALFMYFMSISFLRFYPTTVGHSCLALTDTIYGFIFSRRGIYSCLSIVSDSVCESYLLTSDINWTAIEPS